MTNPVVELSIKGPTEDLSGIIAIELDIEKAPLSVENFLKYVREGHYEGTIFHRVIPGFMIQGGGFNTEMHQKRSHEPIENEAANGLKNEPYTIALARTSDPHSGTCQFFINTAPNPFLNHTGPSAHGWGYAVFGKVTTGKDLVDKITKIKTRRFGFHDDVPQDHIVIEKAYLVA